MVKYYTSKLTTAIELADLIESKPQEEKVGFFLKLPDDKAVPTFEYLPIDTQKQILNEISLEKSAHILEEISPDDRTALLQELPTTLVNQLIKFFSPSERATTIKLLGYPEGSVGRLMTPDYLSISMKWTVKEVLDYIRKKGKDSETINVIYAVDENGVLVDDFRIRQFLISPLDAPVSSLSDSQFVALTVDQDEESAINVFRKYDRVALPVIDMSGVLLGIVTFDDILKVATEEDTKDMQIIAGVRPLEEPYLKTPFFQLMRKRGAWLMILFIGEMLTASAMAFFEKEIAQAVMLAVFIPLIISSGGNAGSQASTLIIRALALDEISFKDAWVILRREIFSGIFLGSILGLLGFLRVVTWGVVFHSYGAHTYLLGLTIFFSLLGVVMWGTLSGAMFPLLLRSLGIDPAVASAPLVATIVDVVGIVIYFSTALLLLTGTLL